MRIMPLNKKPSATSIATIAALTLGCGLAVTPAAAQDGSVETTAATSERSPSIAERLDAFNAWVEEVGQTGDQQAVMQQVPIKLEELFGDINMQTISVGEAEELVNIVQIAPTLRGPFTDRVEALAEQDGLTGLRARVVSLLNDIYPTRTPPTYDQLEPFFADPAYSELLAGNHGDVLGTLIAVWASVTPSDDVKEHKNRLVELSKAAADPDTAGELEMAVRKLDFIGSTAPSIDFDWVSGDRDWKNLADLEGKIVILDFWATWCGPCIAAFPKMRELVAHYEGYPVVVVGVTSIQGAHFQEGERINTQDDPERERSLMPGFMEVMDMTWPVAFSQQRVFNEDYFVQGIPHITIIDPSGTVRYNGLNPHMFEPGEEFDLIDGLLEEFKLPVPERAESSTEG